MSAELAIRDAIAGRGPITFAEFMELALYGSGGYYASGSPISASGDYFTAPSAHPVFGALLCVQLREMWRLLGSPAEFTVIEEGAGNGGLAADISEYAARLDSDFSDALNYVAVDIAPPARQHFPVLPLEEAPAGITGCVLSNELLDAMPVHRFEVRDGEVFEIFVTLEGDRFAETLQPPSSLEIERTLAPFVESLPDGYRGEINLQLESWAQRQAKALGRGWVLAIDYGFERSELYRPGRTSGSLRTYYQHTLGQDTLRHAGEQDITAHVDCTALDEAMTSAEFQLTGKTTQAEFLSRLGIHQAVEQLEASNLSRPESRANEQGIRSLLDPDGMGRFVVAAYSRGIDQFDLAGLSGPADGSATRLPDLPRLNPARHINLVDQQQTGGYFEVQSLEDLFSDRP